MEPRTRQEKESQRKKALMLDVALELFDQYGYEQTTVRQICGVCGMSTGSFYNFFRDKLGLIRELYVRILAESTPFLAPTPEHVRAPFQAICDYFVRSSSLYGCFRPSVARQLHTEASRLLTGEYDAPREETFPGLVAPLVKAAKEAGTMPADLDLEKMTAYLIAVSLGTTSYWLYRADKMTHREAMEGIFIPALCAITDEPVRYNEDAVSDDFPSLASTSENTRAQVSL